MKPSRTLCGGCNVLLRFCAQTYVYDSIETCQTLNGLHRTSLSLTSFLVLSRMFNNFLLRLSKGLVFFQDLPRWTASEIFQIFRMFYGARCPPSSSPAHVMTCDYVLTRTFTTLFALVDLVLCLYAAWLLAKNSIHDYFLFFSNGMSFLNLL